MRLRLTRTRGVGLVIGAAAIVAGTAGSLGSAHAASGRQAIPNTRPAWLNHATNQGHASPGAAVDARIYLAPNGGMAKLQQFARGRLDSGQRAVPPLPQAEPVLPALRHDRQ